MSVFGKVNRILACVSVARAQRECEASEDRVQAIVREAYQGDRERALADLKEARDRMQRVLARAERNGS